MYPKFIEVHEVDGDVMSLNVDHIVRFRDGMIVDSSMDPGRALVVLESYDDIKQLITDCGCLIYKHGMPYGTIKPSTDYHNNVEMNH